MSLSKPAASLLTLLGVVLVGVVDFATGVELRVWPLYYLPLSLAAWHLRRGWMVVVAAGLCSAAWLASNYLAGLTFSTPAVWLFNVLTQGASFVVVGLLIATLRTALVHEQELSRTDPLTSLLNARALYEEAERTLALSRRRKRPVTVACIDLDDFKLVNDTQGHHEGDQVLRSVATMIRTSTRNSDLAARMGGDEFLLLLPETGLTEATLMLDRLGVLLAEALSHTPGPVTASIGGVVFLTVPDSLETMVQEADRRLYAAKAKGKKQVQLDVVGERSVGPHPVPSAGRDEVDA
jgi:diguanylate cyclase (GGDEF)-like protein